MARHQGRLQVRGEADGGLGLALALRERRLRQQQRALERLVVGDASRPARRDGGRGALDRIGRLRQQLGDRPVELRLRPRGQASNPNTTPIMLPMATSRILISASRQVTGASCAKAKDTTRVNMPWAQPTPRTGPTRKATNMTNGRAMA